jgi:hypothetical protein
MNNIIDWRRRDGLGVIRWGNGVAITNLVPDDRDVTGRPSNTVALSGNGSNAISLGGRHTLGQSITGRPPN